MSKEVELDFLEPSLAIIIANLENVENELENEKIEKQNLSKLIDKFNDVEDLNILNKLIIEFFDQKNNIENKIKELKKADKFEVLCSLKSAIQTCENLSEKEFLFEHISQVDKLIKENKIANDYDVFENYKILIISKINETYSAFKEKFISLYDSNDEFFKVLHIACENTNLDDLREASELLINLFKINYDENKTDSKKQFDLLIKADSLISLIDIWSEFQLEEE